MLLGRYRQGKPPDVNMLSDIIYPFKIMWLQAPRAFAQQASKLMLETHRYLWEGSCIAWEISPKPVVRCINADIFVNVNGRSEDLNSGRSFGSSASISFRDTDVGLPCSTQILLQSMGVNTCSHSQTF
jgi:hypothetical protein